MGNTGKRRRFNLKHSVPKSAFGEDEKLIVIPGPASLNLGRKVAELMKSKVISLEFKRFPDGESYIRFDDDPENEDVVIVQTISPPQNENLIQLFLMVDNARDLKAKTITAVIPYFAYARQDKRFRSGEVLSVKTVMTLLYACGVDRLFTVNSHNPEILKSCRVPTKNLSAIRLLAEYFQKQGFKEAFSLSLGKKALDMAKEADEVLSGGYGYISTQRNKITGKVTIEKKSLPIKNKDVIIFDDIISSGGTMVEAVKWVREQEAKRIYPACVHPLLIGDAIEKILRSGADEIIGTDCVPSPVSVVSVSTLIAEALNRFLH